MALSLRFLRVRIARYPPEPPHIALISVPGASACLVALAVCSSAVRVGSCTRASVATRANSKKPDR
eukprot:10908616-Alexandrium_andersonii.AAC.1